MPKIAYIDKRFTRASLEKIAQAEVICREYAAMGYSLTLRQLYYQFVARSLIPNKQTEYDNLGSLINDARLAGLIDWNHLEDRTRNLRDLAHWSDPAEIMDSAAASYRIDLWENQPNYVEVWIEKDALVGLIDGVCSRNDVPYFSCRGYASQSEVWRAARRLIKKSNTPTYGLRRDVTIIHLGDHDPSGIDMTRDIEDRLSLFMLAHHVRRPKIRRIALNFDQVEQYDPPPNPAKLSDSRAQNYVREHGYESWELDALTPQVIDALIQEAIDGLIDIDLWNADQQHMEADRERIELAARQFREDEL